MIIRVFFIVFIYSLFFQPVVADISSYSGGVKTFASSSEYIALHEHGITYDEDGKNNEYSHLVLMKSVGDSFQVIKKVDSSEFVALTWSPNSEFLVAVSNLYGSESNHVFIFDSTLSRLVAAPWGCKQQNYNPLFCSGGHADQQWINKMLDRISVISTTEGIELCIDRFCQEFRLPSS